MSEHKDKTLFVVSDLHMGNGSLLDQFARSRAETLFLHFLDYVDRQQGHLIITGDLLELWRFNVADVLQVRHKILDRLAALAPVYIPGNHDNPIPRMQHIHPLFAQVRSPFNLRIGDRCFRFMHGHEMDPLISHRLYSRTLPGFVLPAFALKDGLVRWTGDALPDLVLECGERVSRVLHWPTRKTLHRIHPTLRHIPRTCAEKPQRGKVRVRKMLSRLQYDRDRIDYDVAVTGHTHRAGQYDDWYYNSGCWIKTRHSFLQIRPDGHTEVFDWTPEGPRYNRTLVWRHRPKPKQPAH